MFIKLFLIDSAGNTFGPHHTKEDIAQRLLEPDFLKLADELYKKWVKQREAEGNRMPTPAFIVVGGYHEDVTKRAIGKPLQHLYVRRSAFPNETSKTNQHLWKRYDSMHDALRSVYF